MNRGLYSFPTGGVRARICSVLPPADGDGDLVLIRAGDPTPFTNVAGDVVTLPPTHVLMCYDASQGRWFSDGILVMAQNGADWGYTTGGGAYAEMGANSQMTPRRVFLQHFRALWMAGLRPQVEVSGWHNGSGAGSNYFFQVLLYQMDYDGSPGANLFVATQDPIVAWKDSTDRYKTSGWVDFSLILGSLSTHKHGNLYMNGKMTGATAGALRGHQMWFRWASAI